MELFENLTILSLEQATVLPYLTYRLAQDGMNVIRLEHPVYGDPNRMIGENVLSEERMNAYYLCINAGKKDLTLNLAEEEGQKIFHATDSGVEGRYICHQSAAQRIIKNWASITIP